MTDKQLKLLFGMLAFMVAAAVIYYTLSPYVPNDREAVSNLVLGNVLSWPAMVMAYFFGSSSGSTAKNELLAEADDDAPLDLTGSEYER